MMNPTLIPFYICLRKAFIILLCILALKLTFPKTLFALQDQIEEKAELTFYQPENNASSVRALPDNRSWIKKNKWWVISGVVVFVAGATGAGDHSEDSHNELEPIDDRVFDSSEITNEW